MRNLSIHLYTILLVINLLPLNTKAQSAISRCADQQKTIIYFPLDKADIDEYYLNNATAIKKMDQLLTNDTDNHTLEQIIIEASSSPDGNENYNKQLALLRGYTIQNYILDKYPQINPSMTEVIVEEINWQWLINVAKEDNRLPYRQQVIEAVEKKGNNISQESLLKGIGGGEAWRYIRQHYLPYRRAAAVCITLLTKNVAPEAETMIESVIEDTVPSVEIIESIENVTTEMTMPTTPLRPYTRKPFIALKTNLLYDALTVLNVEAEIPIGKRWSVAAEWTFPWWLWSKEQICIELLNGNLEGRYWLGNREKKTLLTGWFVGLYGGGGKYDLEWKRKGYQGEFFSVGASAGFAHKINKKGTLRMEYALSVGYMKTKYREYKPKWGVDEEWHLIRQRSGNYTWVGPTRIKVSLVWMLTYKSRRKGWQ